MEKTLIIVRGIPGSGKSTFAELIGGYICTADDYHMNGNIYNWKPENVALAHLKCQQKVETGMKNSLPRIIVANTSTTEREMSPYYTLAHMYGYKVFSVIVENRHGGVNTHNVPQATLDKMISRFDIKL
jgi:predicted kinase